MKSQKGNIGIILLGFVLILVIVGGVVYLNAQNSKKSDQTATLPPVNENQSPNQNTQTPNSSGSAENTKTITYTDAGYTPSTITVKVGDTVTFQNNSSRPMWTASDMHPVHSAYPGSSVQKCGTAEQSTIFDACTGIQPGQSWSFTFAEAGTWGFHNHLGPSDTGEIVVQE